MSCDQQTDLFIKNLIFKNKVVIFGLSDDEYTIRSIKFFKEKFNYENEKGNIFLDKLSEDNNLNLNECLKKRTQTNKLPMVYLNGMFIGGLRSIEHMDYRKDFDIFF
jgi:glutaredoxin-related protein